MGQVTVSRPVNPPIVVPDGALVAGRLDRNALAVTHGQHWSDQIVGIYIYERDICRVVPFALQVHSTTAGASCQIHLNFSHTERKPVGDDPVGTTTP